jgi:hypothetical protein
VEGVADAQGSEGATVLEVLGEEPAASRAEGGGDDESVPVVQRCAVGEGPGGVDEVEAGVDGLPESKGLDGATGGGFRQIHFPGGVDVELVEDLPTGAAAAVAPELIEKGFRGGLLAQGGGIHGVEQDVGVDEEEMSGGHGPGRGSCG